MSISSAFLTFILLNTAGIVSLIDNTSLIGNNPVDLEIIGTKSKVDNTFLIENNPTRNLNAIGSWAVGGGLGKAYYLYTNNSQAMFPKNFLSNSSGYKFEIETGYYTKHQGYDIYLTYAEIYSNSDKLHYRDQQLSLMGEYRLILFTDYKSLQGAVGVAPMLRKLHYWSDDNKDSAPVIFMIQPQFSLISFTADHLILRLQTNYAFSLINLKHGTLGISLRLLYRS